MSDDGDPRTGDRADSEAASTGRDDRAAAEGTGDEETGATGTEFDPEDPADVVERVAEHDEELAGEIEAMIETARGLRDQVERLETEIEDREAEIEDLESRLKRKQADFQNYKKRRKRKEEEIRERATEDLVERLVGVRDDLLRAVREDHDDVEGLREGVKMTLKELDRVLDAENVEAIEPEAGEEVDPGRHEVMMRVEADQPEGTVVDVYEPGYEMAGKVLRAAKVTVSEGGDGNGDDESDEDGPGDDVDSSEAE